MNNLPDNKAKELILAIENLDEYDKIEIKKTNGKVEILRRSLYKEIITLDE